MEKNKIIEINSIPKLDTQEDIRLHIDRTTGKWTVSGWGGYFYDNIPNTIIYGWEQLYQGTGEEFFNQLIDFLREYQKSE